MGAASQAPETLDRDITGLDVNPRTGLLSPRLGFLFRIDAL
jgi:hypothetical protein